MLHSKGGGIRNHLKIISYDELLREYNKKLVYIVIASPRYEQEILENLSKDFDSKSIFSFECELYYSYIHNISQYREWMREKEKDFDKLYEKLEDNLSKKTLENVLKGRISGDLQYFHEVFVQDQYFPKDIIKLGSEEVFCDVGAFNGDTTKGFLEVTKGNYEKIYCFEPDKKACIDLQNSVKNEKHIEIIQKGAWDIKDSLYIVEDSEHGTSKVADTGNYAIDLAPIDECIQEGKRITYIKMDIEGAEVRALQGAKRIICENAPKLAICLYHKNEDFLEIPKLLLSFVPDYKLYLRHHNVSGTETVLYAVK